MYSNLTESKSVYNLITPLNNSYPTMNKILLALIPLALYYSSTANAQLILAPTVPNSESFSNVVRVQCESHSGRTERCVLPTEIRSARRIRTLSRTSCGNRVRQGLNFIEVRGGCRAIFSVTLASSVRSFEMDCESNNRSTTTCNFLGGFTSAWIYSRFSNTGCVQGLNWWVMPVIGRTDQIRVTGGCRARFTVRTLP